MNIRWNVLGKLQTFEQLTKYTEDNENGFETVSDWVDVPTEEYDPIELESCFVYIVSVYCTSLEIGYSYISSHKNFDVAYRAVEEYVKDTEVDISYFKIEKIELT